MSKIKPFLMRILLLSGIILFSCNTSKQISFTTIDTDFSKGRLTHIQTISLKNLENFHGHLCDGLIEGALAIQFAMKELYPNQPIDRTNLRIVSKPSPCLADVAIYLTGGRYQFNTFYVDTTFKGLCIIQRIDNKQTVAVSRKEGIKPMVIDSLGVLATKQLLSPCNLDSLKMLEDNYAKYLLKHKPEQLFTITRLDNFIWQPTIKNGFIKTDILNKNSKPCDKTPK